MKTQHKLLFRSLLALGLLGSVACGDDKPKSGGHSSDATAGRVIDCRQDVAELALDDAADPALRHVPANDLYVSVSGQAKTLCDLVRDSGGQTLTSFQFVSMKCFSCMKWAAATSVEAAKYPDVLHVVVVTDAVDDLSAEEMAALQAEVAPGSVWVRDQGQQLWQFFSTGDDPAAPTSPLTLLMDYAARGAVVTDPALTLAKMVEWANAKMELAIAPKK
jgi:hypothetical protein